MRFDNEALFVSLVSNYGMNLYLGAGFSVYADNEAGEKLPLGNEINKHLIDVFGLKTNREYTLSKSCQKIKKDNKDALERLLKETYRVKSFDKMYTGLCRLPIKNIITLNIDNLVERIYEDESSTKIIADNNITGPLEKNNVVNLYKLHGSVTYPMGSDMSFTDKELTDLFVREPGLFNTVSLKLSSAPTLFWGTSFGDNDSLELICHSEIYSKSATPKWIVVYPLDNVEDTIEDLEDLGFNIVVADTMNKSSSDAIALMEKNENISLLEIVFFASTNAQIKERISGYIKDLAEFKDEKLKIDLLELYTLVNYTSSCGIPATMDMLYFYFGDLIENYEDIIYALKKMNKIIVETTDEELKIDESQDYLIMRSKLFAEKSIFLIPPEIFAHVLEKFLDKVSPHAIYRYDIFKRKAYDADFTRRAFSKTRGIQFYEKLLLQNSNPYVRHQYSIFLQRKGDINLAWEQIDRAHTECQKKIFSIANTHAIIMFEKNMAVEAKNEKELDIQKNTIGRSFSTLEYCLSQDIRVSYHALTYARNAIRYYEKFGKDEFSESYIDSATVQLNSIIDSKEYIYRPVLREMKTLLSELREIKSVY